MEHLCVKENCYSTVLAVIEGVSGRKSDGVAPNLVPRTNPAPLALAQLCEVRREPIFTECGSQDRDVQCKVSRTRGSAGGGLGASSAPPSAKSEGFMEFLVL